MSEVGEWKKSVDIELKIHYQTSSKMTSFQWNGMLELQEVYRDCLMGPTAKAWMGKSQQGS